MRYLLALLLFAGCVAAPAKPDKYYSKCTRCGAEFWHTQPAKDVDNCPMCPMTEEEFEKMLEDIKRQQEGK